MRTDDHPRGERVCIPVRYGGVGARSGHTKVFLRCGELLGGMSTRSGGKCVVDGSVADSKRGARGSRC